MWDVLENSWFILIHKRKVLQQKIFFALIAFTWWDLLPATIMYHQIVTCYGCSTPPGPISTCESFCLILKIEIVLFWKDLESYHQISPSSQTLLLHRSSCWRLRLPSAKWVTIRASVLSAGVKSKNLSFFKHLIIYGFILQKKKKDLDPTAIWCMDC